MLADQRLGRRVHARGVQLLALLREGLRPLAGGAGHLVDRAGEVAAEQEAAGDRQGEDAEGDPALAPSLLKHANSVYYRRDGDAVDPGDWVTAREDTTLAVNAVRVAAPLLGPQFGPITVTPWRRAASITNFPARTRISLEASAMVFLAAIAARVRSRSCRAAASAWAKSPNRPAAKRCAAWPARCSARAGVS